MDARHYAADEVLRDGSSIHIRAIRPDDKQRLLALFHRLSRESIYYRFFRAKKILTDEELVYYTELDFKENVGLVATLTEGGEEKIIAVGRYSTPKGKPGPRKRAEVAFAVDDARQGLGIGTLLLEHLLPIARANGITEFEADVLGENNRMIEVFSHSGLGTKSSPEGGVIHVTFETKPTEAFLDAQRERERQAAARSVRTLFHPRSVAVVGASRQEGTPGANLLKNLLAAGFKGKIHPVNPAADTLQGLRVYKSVQDIGEAVDLALIAVPAAKVEAAVAECAAAGVRAAVIVTAGFAETGEEGRALERRILKLVRGSGMRMVGPNCLGILSTDPEAPLHAMFAGEWPPAGNIGFLSQSGALGIAILDYVRGRDIGISSFVSVGNKSDISGNDLLAYWDEDPRTHVIVLYLESFGNPRKFAALAPSVARRKPIVAVKSGRSAAGTRAASSHSAALANLDVAVDALFEQAGVIRTNTLKDLFDVSTLLATQPLPPGPRVGVVTNAGGPGILLADACEAVGLELPELGPNAVEALSEFLPAEAGLANPVDMVASATARQYERALEIVGNDDEVDCVVAMYIPVEQERSDDVARAVAAGAGKVPKEKPVLCVYLSSERAPRALAEGPRGALPVYEFPEEAALALGAAHRHARWRERPRGEFLKLSPFVQSAVRAVVERVLRGADGSVWLEPRDIATLLKAVGIEFAECDTAPPAEAAATAERLGYPLVAKAIAPNILHKSDVGGVILGLESADAVAEAAEILEARMRKAGSRLEGVFLQRQVKGGIEMIAGVTSDPTFGPLLVCGMGGVTVELLKDVSFRLPPVSDLDAEEMVEELRTARLLDGYRGAPPGDRKALTDLLRRLSLLVELVPEISEMDLNPVKVLEPGKGVIVVDGRIRLRPPSEEETPERAAD